MLEVYFIDDEMKDYTIVNWRNMIKEKTGDRDPNIFFANGRDGFSYNAKRFKLLEDKNDLYILTNSISFLKFLPNNPRYTMYFATNRKGGKNSWALFKDLLEEKGVASVHPVEYLYSYLLLNRVYE